MKNKNGEFPNYKLFNSISHTNVSTYNKIIMIIFFINHSKCLKIFLYL